MILKTNTFLKTIARHQREQVVVPHATQSNGTTTAYAKHARQVRTAMVNPKQSANPVISARMDLKHLAHKESLKQPPVAILKTGAKIAQVANTKRSQAKMHVLVFVRLEDTAKAQPHPQTKTKLAKPVRPVIIAWVEQQVLKFLATQAHTMTRAANRPSLTAKSVPLERTTIKLAKVQCQVVKTAALEHTATKLVKVPKQAVNLAVLEGTMIRRRCPCVSNAKPEHTMIKINNRRHRVAKIAVLEGTNNLKEKKHALVFVRSEDTAQVQPNPQTKTKLAKPVRPVIIVWVERQMLLHAQKERTTMKLVETVSLRVKTAV